VSLYKLSFGWLEFNDPSQHKYGYIRDDFTSYQLHWCQQLNNNEKKTKYTKINHNSGRVAHAKKKTKLTKT